jgi:TfoX/Sxy family transcriptional regulator of competence genes
VPYDEALADRIRLALKGTRALTEMKMFGGIGFLVRGNIACGVIGKEMMVRVGPSDHATTLKEPHVRPFDMTGRPIKGWVVVRPSGLKDDAAVRRWARRGLEFAKGLPAK